MLPAHTPESFRNERLSRLRMEHNLYARRLDLLMSRTLVSPADQWEETRLKKLKLKLKDEMEQLQAS